MLSRFVHCLLLSALSALRSLLSAHRFPLLAVGSPLVVPHFVFTMCHSLLAAHHFPFPSPPMLLLLLLYVLVLL